MGSRRFIGPILDRGVSVSCFVCGRVHTVWHPVADFICVLGCRKTFILSFIHSFIERPFGDNEIIKFLTSNSQWLKYQCPLVVWDLFCCCCCSFVFLLVLFCLFVLLFVCLFCLFLGVVFLFVCFVVFVCLLMFVLFFVFGFGGRCF